MPNNIEQETWNVLNGLNLNSILLHYGKIIVTMTSWKNRIHNCANVIESILHGTLKPDVIFLNISSEEFPCLSDELPDDLMSLCMLNPTVKLNWVSGTNAKSMKKIFPILKYVSDNDIIIDIVARKFYHLYKVSKSERLNSSSFNYIASESILINNGPHNKKKCNC